MVFIFRIVLVLLLLFTLIVNILNLIVLSSKINTLNDSIKNINNTINNEYILIDSKTNDKTYTVRISGYTPTGNKTAIGDTVKAGYTAAVSPKCMFMLGKKIYVENHGIRYVNDLTAKWLDDKFEYCTIDLAVASETHAKKIGNTRSKVVILD